MKPFTLILLLLPLLGASQIPPTPVSPNAQAPLRTPLPDIPPATPEEKAARDVWKQRTDDALVALDKNDLALVERLLTEAMGLARTFTDNRRRQAITYQRMADMRINQENISDAVAAMEEAIRRWDALRDDARIALCYVLLSQANASMGQVEAALNYATLGRQRADAAQDNRYLGMSHMTTGLVYYDLADWERSLNEYEKARARFEAANLARSVAACDVIIGIVLKQLERYERALPLLEKTVATRRTQNNPMLLSNALHALGTTLRGAKQPQKAAVVLDEAVALIESLPIPLTTENVRMEAAYAYWELRETQRAREYARKSLAVLSGPVPPSAQTSYMLLRLWELCEKLGDSEVAAQCSRRAVEVYEASQDGAVAPDRAATNAWQLGSLYNARAHTLRRAGDVTSALAQVERGKVQFLSRQAAQNRIEGRLFDASDAQSWTNTLKELEGASTRRGVAETRSAHLPKDATETERQAALREQSDAQEQSLQAERTFMALRSRLRRKYPMFQTLDVPTRVRAEDIVALARRPEYKETLFVELAVVDNNSLLVFAVDAKNGVRGWETPMGDAVKIATTWRRRIEAQTILNDPRRYDETQQVAAKKEAALEPQSARALYNILFAPLVKAKAFAPSQYKRMIIIADGPLVDIPFAALIVDGAKPMRLIDRYALSTAISLQTLLPVQNAPRSRPTGSLLCAADPIEEAVAGQKVALRSPLARDEALGSLVEARTEASEISAQVPGGGTLRRVLIGREATEQEVKRLMRQYRILHFATHGILVSADGLRSWLAFAEVQERTGSEKTLNKEDGRLEAREVMAMRLTADMAVLSACESGRGQRSGGEGLLGLAWGFQAAGCPAVVASQWKVSDVATSTLMTTFYKNLRRGQTKDDALRGAMQTVRAQYPSPYYWASFQVIGSTIPLFAAPGSAKSPRVKAVR